MTDLSAAYRGYEYQDLLAACRLVDVLLGEVVHVHVDEKLVPDDRFDDLTTVDVTGNRERTQFKHTENEDRPLTLATFTSDSRSLRLDRLVLAALADRQVHMGSARDFTFRVVLRDTRPEDGRLLAVLRPANPDPGPFLHGMLTLRMRFDPEALTRGSASTGTDKGADTNPFLFLFEGNSVFSRADLEWVCERLVIEVEGPAASRDLTAPRPAEHLLLTRVRHEIGAEFYPNAHRSAVDVAEAFVRTARSARQGGVEVTATELLRRAQLRHDFGAVARAHPVDRAIEVLRRRAVGELVQAADTAADTGRSLLVVGPPGQGKSWVCQQVIEELSHRGWLVAEHYCYLGDADGERLPRVLAESVFGSLLRRLAESDPRLVSEQRPRFAADEQALVSAIARSLGDRPGRRVALVVDGIDHVTRVRAGGPDFDPSFTLAEALGSLGLPPGSVLLVLSQPGPHLRPLEDAGAVTVQVPTLTDSELQRLSALLGVVPGNDDSARLSSYVDSPLLTDDDLVAEFLTALSERSAGNALYATYLCREALRHPATVVNPSAIVRSLPPFDGSLLNYYRHLHAALGDQGAWVADVIALLAFPITRVDLREIRPDMAYRVDDALSVLEPVLVERAAQGGVRVYHESFARFLRRPFQDDTTTMVALLDHIATWLKRKGMLDDSRSFRFLLPTLAEANHDREVVDIVGHDFVVRAVAAGFPASAIISNLATAIGCAGRIGNWPAIIRYVEMGRAAEAYQEERFDSTMVDFADVHMALVGTENVADRLLHDGRPVMAARAGLQMCSAADALGAVPPWREYMTAHLREAETDNTSYGVSSDRRVSLAWLRGRLRLSSIAHGTDPNASHPSPSKKPDQDMERDGDTDDVESDLTAPVEWERLARWLEAQDLPGSRVIDAVLDTYGVPAVVRLIRQLDHPGGYCLALAESISIGVIPDSYGSPRLWASTASAHGVPPGNDHRLIALGVDVDQLDGQPVPDARRFLLDLTRQVQGPSAPWAEGKLGQWLDACAVAARRDPLGLASAEALISGAGWYRCWLRFTVGLNRAEAALGDNQKTRSVDAMRLLTADLNPFSGDPRACDLYPIHGVIDVTIRRAVALLDDEGWGDALRLLDEVSNSITTSLFGTQGGPIPPDSLLRLAVETATPTRIAAARVLVEDEIENGAGGKHYSDLAEYRLLGARLALAAGDENEARRLWVDASRMLTAYGWHKDITIYELLDPLPALIIADPARGRAAVAKLQPLCERIPLHTDGDETRGAWGRWWDLLAACDPAALARLVTPTLLAQCNEPNSLLHDARSELWRVWHHRVDPIVAGALRLTLEEPLDSADPEALASLVNISDGTGSDVPARLMTLLLARTDERPFRYGVSNSVELLDRDAGLVDALNSLADRAFVQGIAPMPAPEPDASQVPTLHNGISPQSAPSRAVGSMPVFAAGAVGLARAIRVWRSRRYDETAPEWAVERFANVIGYRVVELAESGRHEDAAAAVRFVADATSVFDRSGILGMLAKGIERNNQTRLASMAYTLAWMRTRGGGGWLTFGGETEMVSLKRAAELDYELTLKTLAQEIEQIVSRGSYGTYGISQALVYAFAVGSLGISASSGLDIAFGAWEEAFKVIADRAPRVDRSDDPDEEYVPPEPDAEAEPPGDLEAAFAAAAVAGVAHAAREQKRRSMVALQLLLKERPTQSGSAFKLALASLSDPATLMWLLRTLESAGDGAVPVLDNCADVLAELASGSHLTVRALARRLLDTRDALPLPVSQPDPELLGSQTRVLWTPTGAGTNLDEKEGRKELINAVAGARLAQAEPILPGLRNAVRARVEAALAKDDNKKRTSAQLDAYADRIEERWPDAYLAPMEAIEDALQRAAAGGRAARLAQGRPVYDPLGWEDGLATALLDDPLIPVSLEATRQPRPNLDPPPQRGDSLWRALRSRAEGVSADDTLVEAAVQEDGRLLGTLTMLAADVAPTIRAGRFGGWRWLAMVERRIYPPRPRKKGQPDFVAERYRVVEVRGSSNVPALTLQPVAEGNSRSWITRHRAGDSLFTATTSPAIVGVDSTVSVAGDGHYGLGIQTPLLTPTAWLVATLGLDPITQFVLDDNDGAALALVTWRTEYDTSEYHLAWPRLCGSAIAIRQDVFDRLLSIIDRPLVIREFLTGDVGLCD